jgi:hypothetical protein
MLKYDIFCGFENRNALLFKKKGEFNDLQQRIIFTRNV